MEFLLVAALFQPATCSKNKQLTAFGFETNGIINLTMQMINDSENCRKVLDGITQSVILKAVKQNTKISPLQAVSSWTTPEETLNILFE